MSDKTKIAVFWSITILLPIIFLSFIEISLRLGGYNAESQELFIEAPNTSSFLVSNPKFIERYFPNFVPQIAPNAFRKVKRSNTFRVFVFGGSSTQGFPYNFYYSFAEQLEQRLLLNTEGVHVEVINLGMTAVNSYVIRDLSQRVMEYEPDAVIIYAGHNEYYGSFGAASTQFGFVNNIYQKRIILWLKDLRFYQLLENIASSENKDTGERRTMMAKVIRDADIEQDGEIFDHGIKQYELNIKDVIEHFTSQKVPVFIGTVASNLKNQAPLTEDETALNIYKEAQKLFEEGELVKALSTYIEAKERDGIRFRAPNRINDTIRDFGNTTSATVVDIEHILRANSESGIEDASLFIDHLHPNYKGHQLIAEEFFNALLDMPRLQSRIVNNGFSPPTNISRFEETYSNVAISRLLAGYPFTKNITVDQELRNYEAIFNGYVKRSYIDSLAAYASKEQIHTPIVLTEVVNESQLQSDTVTTITHYYELLKWQLNSIDLIEKGIELAVNYRDTDEYLVIMLLQILNDGNYDPRYMDVLSSIYLLRENTTNAEYWLKESERLEPNSPRMLYNYTRFHLLRQDSTKMQQYFKRFMEAQKRN